MGKFSEMIKGETPVLVDFYATWCGPCKAMSPILDQLKHKKGKHLRIVKIDVDKNQEVAAQFKIRSVPTLMLFHNGKTVWRHSGGMDLRTLISKTTV